MATGFYVYKEWFRPKALSDSSRHRFGRAIILSPSQHSLPGVIESAEGIPSLLSQPPPQTHAQICFVLTKDLLSSALSCPCAAVITLGSAGSSSDSFITKSGSDVCNLFSLPNTPEMEFSVSQVPWVLADVHFVLPESLLCSHLFCCGNSWLGFWTCSRGLEMSSRLQQGETDQLPISFFLVSLSKEQRFQF